MYDNISIDHRDRATIIGPELLNYLNFLLELENLDEMIKQRIVDIQSKVSRNYTVNKPQISLSQFRSLVSIADKLLSEEQDDKCTRDYLIDVIADSKELIRKAEEMQQESMLDKSRGNVKYIDEF
jgi:hypothetical protein